MRQDIEFDAEGVALRGWPYRPDGASGPMPTIVMAHGFSAVKEMYLDSFGEAFTAGGWGHWCSTTATSMPATASQPRQEIDPRAQVRDYRHAITYPRPVRRSTPTASASGGPAPAAPTCWWWARSTGGSSASPRRCR